MSLENLNSEANMSDTNWKMEMDYTEACNCNHGCGCQFAGFPDRTTCEALICFEVKSGFYQDGKLTDLSGVKVALGAMWPGAIHEGNGSGVLFIGKEASEDQVKAIGLICAGQAGGMPLEALATTFSEFEGPVKADLKMDMTGRHPTVTIDGILSLKNTPIKHPITGDDQNVHITYPGGGFLWNDGAICTTETMELSYNVLNFKHPGKFAAKANVNWPNG